MDITEATTILEIMVTADNTCIGCARKLFEEFILNFPTFKPQAEQIFLREFDEAFVAKDE